ncbi:major facilitator superfamily transporter [Colletotrichum abscissum]|uniref:Major facilitator superfamily transporter n=1 Tax=Colletotrichum abscissum TaxID=1671311 RepID=A0A9P9XCE4_9PEZI|nr:major facilitator superfamily transporter [Colletotrichum abscissum]KAI3547978.1 major facilitator superfamily transporter [Colletotrichum abscissum]KAK1483785.1 major facilitator superfamily transporter [Colletotrichum abscissum]
MSATQTETPAVVLEKQTTQIDQNGKVVFKPSREFLLAFSALCAIALAVAFDATTLSVALPTMSVALGGTALEAFWSGTSFLLASTVLQPTVAGLSNIFGRKALVYVSALLFAVGSIVGALANNFHVVIAGRTIQGVGGGGILALTEVIITDLVPLAVRGQWFSLLSAVWSVGTVTGPLIGAGFAQNISWRWIFWINLPIIAIGAVMIFFFLKQAKVPGHIGTKLKKFDWLGSFLFTAGSTSFLFGISTGGVMYEWASFRCLLPMILGVFILVAFGFWELKFAPVPMIDKGIFNNWTMVANYIMTIFHGMILWSILYFLVLYYQAVKDYSVVVSAVAALPESLTVAPSAMAVGLIAGVTGRYRWSLWAGWVMITFGAGLMCLMRPDTSVPAWIWLNIPIGLGTGMLFPAMALSIQAACEPALNGQAAAFYSFLRTFGQSVGVAVSGVIFQNAFRNRLLDIPSLADVAEEYSRDATIVVEVIKRMPKGDAMRADLVEAYCDALRAIWISLIAFGGFCMLISVTVKKYSLEQEHVTDQRLVTSDDTSKEDEESQGGDLERGRKVRS